MRLPGFVNAHSHAFQRRLRGVVEHVDPAHPHDDFWTWREAMYAEAGRLDPDSAHEVALLAYREMRRRRVRRGGRVPLSAPPPRRLAVRPAERDGRGDDGRRRRGGHRRRAAHDGLRAGRRGPPADARASAGSATLTSPPTCARVDALAAGAPGPGRPRAAQRPGRARAAGSRRSPATPRATGMVVHIHACEQRREIEECLAEHGRRPIELLADAGLLDRADDGRPRHACLGRRARPDGRGRAPRSARARRPRPTSATATCPPSGIFERGIRVCIGSDSNTVIDPIQEVREVEAIARRSAERRNVLVPPGDSGPTPLPAHGRGARTAPTRSASTRRRFPRSRSRTPSPSWPASRPSTAAAALVFGGVRPRIGRSSTFGTQS